MKAHKLIDILKDYPDAEVVEVGPDGEYMPVCVHIDTARSINQKLVCYDPECGGVDLTDVLVVFRE